MKSSAYAFLLVGVGGIVLLILAFAGVLPGPLAEHMKGLMGIVMGGMFLIFFVIGMRSACKLGGLKAQVLAEQQQTDAAHSWFYNNYSAKAVDVSMEINASDELQQKFFLRSQFIKRVLCTQFPDYEDSFLDFLTEQFYEELFPHD